MTDLERDPITQRLQQATQTIRLLELNPDDFQIEPLNLHTLSQKIQQLGFGKSEPLLPESRQPT